VHKTCVVPDEQHATGEQSSYSAQVDRSDDGHSVLMVHLLQHAIRCLMVRAAEKQESTAGSMDQSVGY
jgi:hypothetical protein